VLAGSLIGQSTTCTIFTWIDGVLHVLFLFINIYIIFAVKKEKKNPLISSTHVSARVNGGMNNEPKLKIPHPVKLS
jgi:hypothetical protein